MKRLKSIYRRFLDKMELKRQLFWHWMETKHPKIYRIFDKMPIDTLPF